MNASSFPALLERFFTERLLNQMGASPHTIAAYRDTFRLLFKFAEERLPNCAWKISMSHSWANSLITSKASAATRRGHAITAWLLYTPSSNSWPFMNRRWPCSANVSSLSLRSVSCVGRSNF